MLTEDPGPFADADDLVLEVFGDLITPERLTLTEYAGRHRRLTKGFGEETRPFDPATAPYLSGPSDALTSGDYTTVAVAGPGQCAKTTIAENWLQMSVEADPADFLWFMQTHPGMQAFVKDRVDPMIAAHPRMRERLGSDPVDDSLNFKNFGVMRTEFLSFTRTNLISKNAPRIVADEVDNYDDAGIGEAKPVLDVRRQVYGAGSCLLMMSHPDLAVGTSPGGWKRGIMAVYADSTRGTWWWPCPRCGAHSSPNPGASRFMALDYPAGASLDEVRDAARLVCPTCGGLIEDHERKAMNAAGRWIGTGQEVDVEGAVSGQLLRHGTAGFWIVGVMSPFVLGGIGGLARARVAAEQELEQLGEDDTLRQVMVKQWGIPHVPARRVGSVDATAVADRAEEALRLGQVPEGVRFITASADVQANRFELVRRGWGIGGESWVLGVERLPAETATDPAAWDALLEALRRPLPLADGSGRVMRPRAVSMDLGGSAGVTSRAYEAWLRWRLAGKVRLLGRLDGRDAWDVLPTQGTPGLNAARLQVVYPEDVRRERKASGIARGQVPVARFNPNLFKDDLAAQLERADPGPWFVHFPAELKDRAGPPHPWFEQLVAERRAPNGSWHKPPSGQRNEAGDLMVMTHVMARLHGIGRIDWDRPPSWAAAWDMNALVGEAGAVAEAVAAAPAAPAPAPPRPAPAAPRYFGGRGRSYFGR
jgi:phage terminase large subunit GpA-like protein